MSIWPYSTLSTDLCISKSAPDLCPCSRLVIDLSSERAVWSPHISSSCLQIPSDQVPLCDWTARSRFRRFHFCQGLSCSYISPNLSFTGVSTLKLRLVDVVGWLKPAVAQSNFTSLLSALSFYLTHHISCFWLETLLVRVECQLQDLWEKWDHL